jgi:ubiquinone/menaquinone biosynthesis C-methylase UbiE
MFSESAAFYDLIYTRFKDYRAESQRLAEIVRARTAAARTVLDVACGTGEHARHLTGLGFAVDGVDL